MRALPGLLVLVVALGLVGLAPVAGAEPTPGHPAATPVALNDPYWPQQRAYLGAIGLEEAWAHTSGSDDLVVAVVDTGVDLDHPDLAGRLLPGYDAVDDDGLPQDENGHGTMVAGILVAVADNGLGVAGMLRKGSVLPVRVLNRYGNGVNKDVADGIRWAADHDADVISISVANYTRSSAVDAAVAYALDRDVVVVAAAGNFSDPRPTYPAASDGVLAVAATDSAGRLASFSNYGDWIDLAAPGIGVLTTGLGPGPVNEVRLADGTSVAAPLVAGAAALARSADPGASAATITDRLRATASDRGPHGTDPYYGAGLLDIPAALGRHAPSPHLDWPGEESEPNGTPDTAAPLGPASVQQAVIAPEGDVDWFAVDVTEPSVLTFTVGPPPPAAGDGRAMYPDVGILDPELRTLPRARRSWSGSTVTLTADVIRAGRYRLRVTNNRPSQSPGPYTVSITIAPRIPSFSYVDDNGDSDTSAPSGSDVGFADIDGDGRAEYLSTEGQPGSQGRLRIQEPDSNGLPKDGVSIGLGALSGSEARFATGDVDTDGDVDVIVALGGRIVLVENSGEQLNFSGAIGPAAEQVEIAELDGDGWPDVVYEGSGRVGWLRHTGSGWIDTPISPQPLARHQVGDVTGDGRPDIIGQACTSACEDVTGIVRVLRSEPDGSFTPIDYPVGGPPVRLDPAGLALGDLDGDGRTDVLLALSHGAPNPVTELYVLNQAPDGTLRPPRLLASRTRDTGPIVVRDIDGDRRADVVAGGPGGAGVFLGRADGTLAAEIFTAVYRQDYLHATTGMAIGDATGDGSPDILLASGELIRQAGVPTAPGPWLQGTTPAEHQFGVDPGVAPEFHLARDLAADLDGADVTVTDARSGATVSADLGWDAVRRTLTVTPRAPLASGPWLVSIGGALEGSAGEELGEALTLRFTVGPRPPLPAGHDPEPPPPPAGPSDPGPSAGGGADVTPDPTGYWMADAAGHVYAFGAARYLGAATLPPGRRLADLEPSAAGNGYWLVDERGAVYAYGGAPHLGNPPVLDLAADESVTSLSGTPSGAGYWIFTTRGRVLPIGDAAFYGDMSAVTLNGPVLDSIPTPTGKGYYMVASDGGVFTFGDAQFHGSMGHAKLNAPVRSLVPDPDDDGYWLVASDGGVFAFQAGFQGSMRATPLNAPVTGMVPYGNGYLMVGQDGGIFNFSDLPFAGSLGDQPPADPVITVAAL